MVSLEGTTCTGHPTHVQVGGDRLRCPLAGVTGASGSPHASGPASNQSRGSRDLGAGWGSGRQVLPHPDFSRKPAPRAFRARLSPRWALGGARLSPATRLGARLGSAAAAARAFLRSSACGRARPARAHAGHQVRGGRRRVSVGTELRAAPGSPLRLGARLRGAARGRGRCAHGPGERGEAGSRLALARPPASAHLMLPGPPAWPGRLLGSQWVGPGLSPALHPQPAAPSPAILRGWRELCRGPGAEAVRPAQPAPAALPRLAGRPALLPQS